MEASQAHRPRTGLSVVLAVTLLLVTATSWAVTTPTVTLQVKAVPEPHFGVDSTFDVLVALTNPGDGYSTAPLGASFRVYFDNSVATPTLIVGSLSMSSALMGPVEGTVPNNWFDIALAGPANTLINPDFCTISFKVLQFLNSSSPMSIDDDPGFSNNLVSLETNVLPEFPFFELLEKEIPHVFGPAVDIGPTVPPTGVGDWHLFR